MKIDFSLRFFAIRYAIFYVRFQNIRGGGSAIPQDRIFPPRMISKRFIGSGMGGGVTCTDGAEKIHFSQTSLWTGSQRRLFITPLMGFP